MAVRLPGARTSADRLAAHDRSQPWIVLPVLAVLLVYCWCYTNLAVWLGIVTPAEFVQLLDLELPRVLDDDGNIAAKLYVSNTALMDGDDERLVAFTALFGGFLGAYFLPLRWRALSAVAWFVPAFAVLYGLSATVVVLAAHLATYIAFHPTRGGRPAAVLGALLGWLLVDGPMVAVAMPVAAGVMTLLIRRVREWLAAGRGASVLRTILVQSCMLTIAVACIYEGLTGVTWRLPVGLVFFFFQWARLMVYQADHRDGLVPRELPVSEYLAAFLAPLALLNMAYAPYLGQAHAYLRARHLAVDKTALVRSGLGLWCLALVYMVFAEHVVALFIGYVDRVSNIKVYAFTSELVREHLRGEPLSTPTVLLSTLVDQARIFLIYGGVTHFRVGAWRVMGYAVETQYDRPWLATNLANLWGRFAFHFREFLVRTFYYPVFLNFFRRRALLRIFAATMVATVIGNLVWGHVPPKTISRLTWSDLMTILSTWPYFVLLGLGISLTQIWLARQPRTRRPWTRDRRFALDLVCAYLTLQYFALIHVFIRPQPGGSLQDYAELVLIGLGIRLE